MNVADFKGLMFLRVMKNNVPNWSRIGGGNLIYHIVPFTDRYLLTYFLRTLREVSMYLICKLSFVGLEKKDYMF